jgi:uncharacterized CHY-type Zn-finger protein
MREKKRSGKPWQPFRLQQERLATEHICPVCKQRFIMRCEVHRYGWQLPSKDGRVYYCSYSCMRKIERVRLLKEKLKIKKKMERAIYGEENHEAARV